MVLSLYLKYGGRKVFLNHIIAEVERKVGLFNCIKCYSKKETQDILREHGFDVIEHYDTAYGEEKKDNDYFAVLARRHRSHLHPNFDT